MKLVKIAFVAAALVAGIAAGTALAKPAYHPAGPEYHPAHPGHKAPPPHGKAFGFYCRGASKKHVKGQQGTEFSRCVKRMARAAANPHMPPGQVCKGLSKKHVMGQKGTEFSRCVQGVAHLRRDTHKEEREAARSLIASHPTGPPEGKGRPEGTPPHDKGVGRGPEQAPAEPGPKEGLPAQAKAHGRRCQGKSKKHVKGEQGTPFSRCVKAAAQQRKEEREAS
jgi:hypothetical protein